MTYDYPSFKNSPSVNRVAITRLVCILALIAMTGCGSTPKPKPSTSKQKSPMTVSSSETIIKQGGGYYLDDGPGENPPPNLNEIPDAIPKVEPLRKANMQPYVALGKTYKPMTRLGEYKAHGIASWYGRRYHGNPTASGEIYDMYAMTAAHPTLPLPSYARVTNIHNGKSVVVRINDRGPFLSDRLIDLSYTAAYKLGVLADGHAKVEVETIIPDMDSSAAQAKQEKPLSPAASLAAVNSNEIYLQLGAFGIVDNAHSFLSHIQTRLPWLSNSVEITQKHGLFKIKAGPYPNQMLAQKAADTITQILEIKPLILID